MSEVYFLDYRKNSNIIEGMNDLFTKSALDITIPPNGSVAVKIHFGEMGNITYLRPVFVSTFVRLVKEAGGKPFITDTTVLYQSLRYTVDGCLSCAKVNGFLETGLGAPVFVADEGNQGYTATIKTPIDGCEIKEVDIAAKIYEADSLLVLSHAKGHDLTGFGGALKNLGMGCTTKKCKAVQHLANLPIYNELQCNACGKCVEICPQQCLSLVSESIVCVEEECTGCASCLESCPQGAYNYPPEASKLFQKNLAHAAYAVANKFKGRIGYVNFIQDVTIHCDCAAPGGRAVVQDIGILASLDPVAIDKASIDLIDQAPFVLSPNQVNPPDLLGKLNKCDSLIQLKTAERLGLGSVNYNLITL